MKEKESISWSLVSSRTIVQMQLDNGSIEIDSTSNNLGVQDGNEWGDIISVRSFLFPRPDQLLQSVPICSSCSSAHLRIRLLGMLENSKIWKFKWVSVFSLVYVITKPGEKLFIVISFTIISTLHHCIVMHCSISHHKQSFSISFVMTTEEELIWWWL